MMLLCWLQLLVVLIFWKDLCCFRFGHTVGETVNTGGYFVYDCIYICTFTSILFHIYIVGDILHLW